MAGASWTDKIMANKADAATSQASGGDGAGEEEWVRALLSRERLAAVSLVTLPGLTAVAVAVRRAKAHDAARLHRGNLRRRIGESVLFDCIRGPAVAASVEDCNSFASPSG